MRRLARGDGRHKRHQVCVCVRARSRDSPQRIASARQLVSVHNWMTSSGRRAPESIQCVHRSVWGGSCYSSHKTHTHTVCSRVSSGEGWLRGGYEVRGAVCGLKATCHLCSNATKTRLYASTRLHGNAGMHRQQSSKINKY